MSGSFVLQWDISKWQNNYIARVLENHVYKIIILKTF